MCVVYMYDFINELKVFMYIILCCYYIIVYLQVGMFVCGKILHLDMQIFLYNKFKFVIDANY